MSELEAIPVSACPIEDLVVYRRGAMVTRRVTWSPSKPGIHILTLTGFPLAACRKDSIRVTAVGPGVIESFHTCEETVTTKEGDVPEEYWALQQKVKEVLAMVWKKEAECRSLSQQEQVILKWAKTVEANVDHQNKLNTYDSNAQKLFCARIALEEACREHLTEARYHLKRMCWLTPGNMHIPDGFQSTAVADQALAVEQFLRGLNTVQTATVSIRVRAGSSQGTDMEPLALRLMYEVEAYGASWTPAYHVSAEEEGQVRLTIYAKVTQRTGEDWGNVPLRLSTADINGVLTTGDMPHEEVQFASASHLRLSKAMPIRARALALSSERIVGSSGEPYGEPHVEVEEKEGCVLYAVMGERSKIPSDSEANSSISVGSFLLECQWIRYVGRSLSASPSVIGRVSNSSPFDLFAHHDLSIYASGNRYIGTVKLEKNVAPGEQFNLNFGPDPSMTATYMPVKTLGSTSWLGNQKSRNYTVTVHLTPTRTSAKLNRKGIPAFYIVGVTAPVSTDSKITVKIPEPLEQIEGPPRDDVAFATQIARLYGSQNKGCIQGYMNTSNNHIFYVVPCPLEQSPTILRYSYSLAWPGDTEIVVERV